MSKYEIEELYPNLWISRDPKDRWLQQGNYRLQLPLRVLVHVRPNNKVTFAYKGVGRLHTRMTGTSQDIIEELWNFIRYILEVDELYEHPIAMVHLHRVSVPGEPHFYREGKLTLGVYTGDPAQGVRCTVKTDTEADEEQRDCYRKLAIAYRQDILATRWIDPPRKTINPLPIKD